PLAVGYAGLKDRHAVTRQAFSVQLAGKPDLDWSVFPHAEVKVLAATRHGRKLKRGALRGNRFVLVLREARGERERAEQVLAAIAATWNRHGQCSRDAGWIATSAVSCFPLPARRSSTACSPPASSAAHGMRRWMAKSGRWPVRVRGSGPSRTAMCWPSGLPAATFIPRARCGGRANRPARARRARWSEKSLPLMPISPKALPPRAWTRSAGHCACCRKTCAGAG